LAPWALVVWFTSVVLLIGFGSGVGVGGCEGPQTQHGGLDLLGGQPVEGAVEEA
jgi:hypothetical protein